MILEFFTSLPINFIKGIKRFFYLWYITESKNFWRKELAFLRQVERDIGVRINMKLWLQPIYGDYSYEGQVIGPIFRTFRIFIGLGIEAVSVIAIVGFYLIWLIIPPLVFFMIVWNLESGV